MSFHLKPLFDGPEQADTLFFVQGWPDDASLWDSAVAALCGRYRCVRVNMPGAASTPVPRWGYDTDEIVEALAQCIRQVSPGVPVTLVIHDLGAYWGYILHRRYPQLVKRIAGLDIAPHVRPNAAEAAGIATYQGFLAAAFLLGGAVGDRMTRFAARLLRAPGKPESIRAAMNYPYRNIWADIFSGRAKRMTGGYWPTLPLLFVYAKRKPFAFHSQRWLEHVRRVGGEVVALDTGHWVQQHPEFNHILLRWLEATDAASTR